MKTPKKPINVAARQLRARAGNAGAAIIVDTRPKTFRAPGDYSRKGRDGKETALRRALDAESEE